MSAPARPARSRNPKRHPDKSKKSTLRPAAAKPAADQREPGRLSESAQRLLRRKIDYIHNASFEEPDAETSILQDPLQLPAIGVPASTSGEKAARGLPRAMVRLCEAPLLSQEEEGELFRRMNFLKFRASQLVEELDADHPGKSAVAELEELLAEADAMRNRIVVSNGRLVMSIVKNLVDSRSSFDELMSEGMESVMRAVDKFDYARGFRFSTFATLVIRRDLYRLIQRNQRRRQRFMPTGWDSSLEVEEQHDSQMNEAAWLDMTGSLERMLDRLDPRERMIIRSRFGLEPNTKAQTLLTVAKKMGISKERVRQLEQRALGKLRKISAEETLRDPDEYYNYGAY